MADVLDLKPDLAEALAKLSERFAKSQSGRGR
jgi:hypothetical protein